jgi:hypothetical protein
MQPHVFHRSNRSNQTAAVAQKLTCIIGAKLTSATSFARRIIAALMVVWIMQSTAQAQVQSTQFRIESQVYTGDSQSPVSQNVTLFADGVVYDFQMSATPNTQPSEIVIFDERKRELTLMDVNRKLSWTVADLRLLTMLDQLRRETANNAKANFLINEPFTEDHDWSSSKVSLESDSFRYVLTGNRPANDTILPRYNEFLDQFTRLSASDPKRLPPFPRLMLNKSIKTLGWIPTEVQVSIKPNAMFEEAFSATSKHVLVMSLSDADRERIKFARDCWIEFQSCSLVEYRQIPAAEKRVAFGSKDESASQR